MVCRMGARSAPFGIDEVADELIRLGRRRVELHVPRLGCQRRSAEARHVVHNRVGGKVGAAERLRAGGGARGCDQTAHMGGKTSQRRGAAAAAHLNFLLWHHRRDGPWGLPAVRRRRMALELGGACTGRAATRDDHNQQLPARLCRRSSCQRCQAVCRAQQAVQQRPARRGRVRDEEGA